MRIAYTPEKVIRVGIALLSAIGLVRIAGLATLVVCGNQRFFLIEDDSLITLRIARNIAHGIGPYFNSGEHVAASTSLFWPFVISPVFHFLSLPRAVLLLSLFSVGMTAFIFVLIAFGASSIRSAILSLATLLLLPSFIQYAPSVWEHIPQTIFTTAALLILLGRPRRLENYSLQLCLVSLSFAFLLRPDTLPLMIAPGLALLHSSRYKCRVSSLAALSVATICILGYFSLHYFLYHSFLPNTYYLKVSLGAASIREGLLYTFSTVIQSVGPLFVGALILLWLPNRRHWKAGEQLALSAMGLQCIYVILVGGDVFENGRFYLLILPIAVLLFWEKADVQVFRTPGITNLISALAITSIAIGIFTSAGYHQARIASVPYYSWQFGRLVPFQESRIGQLELIPVIQEHIRPEDGRIGLFWLGAVSYYLPDYPIADFLGKADPAIALGPVKWGPVGHNKWDIDFSLRERNIAAIPFAPIPEAEARQHLNNHDRFAFFSDLELNLYLKQHYVWLSPEQLGVSGPEGLYVRDDLVSRFQVDQVHVGN